MTQILFVALFIFVVGFLIGMGAFSKSKAQIVYAFFCGFAAIVVVIAVAFAGCALISGR